MDLESYLRERVLGARGWVYLPMWMRRADRDIFHTVAEAESPILDRTLPKLSRAANHGLLWAAIGAGLVAFGGRRGRRAATRGLLSVAAASAVANLPAKFAVRRTRPDVGVVPELRRLLRQPTSFSFPSGHSASAAAFAVGAGLELPVAAPALGVLALGVGASRVYTGVHYPSDVAVGMAIGAGVALLSTRSWPVTRFDGPHGARSMDTSHLDLAGNGEGLTLVVNKKSGSTNDGLIKQIGKALPAAAVNEVPGEAVQDAIEAAVRAAKAIGIAGGDGTVNAAVSAVHDRKLPLLVIPAGTLNHFARDIGIESMDDSIEAWKGGETIAADVATIDGKPFLNTASFGAYAEFVDARELLTRRFGKKLATPIALARVLRRAEPQEVEIDGEKRRLWMAFIGNCRYVPSGFTPAARERLDDGTFDVRFITAERRLSRLRAAIAALTGTLQRSPVYEERVHDSLELRSLDGPLRLARDGETWDGPPSVTVTKSPRPLAVFVPKRENGGR